MVWASLGRILRKTEVNITITRFVLPIETTMKVKEVITATLRLVIRITNAESDNEVEIYKGNSGTYLIESEVLLSRSYDKFIVSFSDTSHLPVSTFKPLQSFQFKKEALAFIEEQEIRCTWVCSVFYWVLQFVFKIYCLLLFLSYLSW